MLGNQGQERGGSGTRRTSESFDKEVHRGRVEGSQGASCTSFLLTIVCVAGVDWWSRYRPSCHMSSKLHSRRRRTSFPPSLSGVSPLTPQIQRQMLASALFSSSSLELGASRFPRFRTTTGSYQASGRMLNVENATNMMISTFKWRDEFNTDALVSEEFPQDVFGPVGHVFGKDKDGRPVT